MVKGYALSEEFPPPYSAVRELVHGNWNWKSGGAAFGLCGGLMAPIFGSMLTVVSWFVDPVWHGFSLHQAGTSLFFLALPLLILGAHCLDLLDKNKELTHTSQLADPEDKRRE